MRIIGLAGWSGSGKTTLLDQGDPAPRRARAQGLDAQARPSRLRRRPAGQGFPHPSHGRRDRGAGRLGEALGARARAARRRRADAARRCSRKLSPVDLVLVEGYKREPHPKLEVHRAARRQAAAAPRRPAHRRHRLRRAAAGGARSGGRSRRHRAHRRHSDPARRAARRRAARTRSAADGAAHRRLLRVLGSAAAGRRGRAHHRASASRRSPRSRPCRSPPRAGA